MEGTKMKMVYFTIFRKKKGEKNWFKSNIRRLPHLLHLRANQYQLLRNLFPMLPNLHELQRILLPPYLHRRTSEQKHAWHTSSRICDQDEPMLLQWQWCCSTYIHIVDPWPNLHQEQLWEVGS